MIYPIKVKCVCLNSLIKNCIKKFKAQETIIKPI